MSESLTKISILTLLASLLIGLPGCVSSAGKEAPVRAEQPGSPANPSVAVTHAAEPNTGKPTVSAVAGTEQAQSPPVPPEKVAETPEERKPIVLWSALKSVLEPDPKALQEAHDRSLAALRHGNRALKEVALTFDDGPHAEFTPRLLDMLREHNVRATFFVVGEKVDESPDLTARIVQEGHEIANHTYHHFSLAEASLESVKDEITRTNDAVKAATGIKPAFFRPPGGRFDDAILGLVRDLSMKTALWSDNPADFSLPGESQIMDRLLKHLENGSIILLHSSVEQTLAVLPDLIARLRREGYAFVTMSEMAQHLEAASHVESE